MVNMLAAKQDSCTFYWDNKRYCSL